MAGGSRRLEAVQRWWGVAPQAAVPVAGIGPPAPEGPIATAGRLVVIALLYAVVAGAVLGTFMQKWSFLEYCGRFGLQEMVEGSAERPFVYRQLMPYLVRQAEARVPPAAREALLAHLARSPRLAVYALYTPGDQLSDACASQASLAAADGAFKLRHALMYLLCYAALFGTLWVMQAVCRRLSPDDGWVWVWPLCFALALPYTFRMGGYFYDFGELLLLFALLWLVLARQAVAFLVVLALAMLNKESALIFPVILAPLLVAQFGVRQGAVLLGAALAEAAWLMAWIHGVYAGNAGDVREFHLHENLHFWLSPKPYGALGTHAASFIPLPTGANVLVLAALAYLWWRFGRHAPGLYRRTLALALAINLPLFLVYCWRDETRNLSLTFPVLFVCLYAGWRAQRVPAAGAVR